MHNWSGNRRNVLEAATMLSGAFAFAGLGASFGSLANSAIESDAAAREVAEVARRYNVSKGLVEDIRRDLAETHGGRYEHFRSDFPLLAAPDRFQRFFPRDRTLSEFDKISGAARQTADDIRHADPFALTGAAVGTAAILGIYWQHAQDSAAAELALEAI